MSELQVGGTRRVRRRIATLVGVVGTFAALFVPAGGAVGVADGPYEVWDIAAALKCNGTNRLVCQTIPGYPQPQLGEATASIQLFRNLVTGEKWGSGEVTFHVHTIGATFQDDPPTGPHPTAIKQESTYFTSPGRPAWFTAPSPLLQGRNIFFVNGTRVDHAGFLFRDDENVITLVNQPTQHPATPGHYDFAALIPGFPQPQGVSVSINVSCRVFDPAGEAVLTPSPGC